MKTLKHPITVIMIVFLHSCVRSANVSNSSRYAKYIGQYRYTQKNFIIYEDVEPGSSYRNKMTGVVNKMTHPSAIDIVKQYGDSGTFYRFVPEGTKYRITRIVRNNDPSGTWDYVIGDAYLSGKPVQFRFMLGEIGINPNLHNNMP